MPAGACPGGSEVKVMVSGFDGPVARATRTELERKGHAIGDSGAECTVFLPGSLDNLEKIAADRSVRRLVLRSHAYAYGSSTKNPGLITEERISLLPPNDPAQRWLRAEEIAARHANSAAVRLTNVLA